MRATGATSPPPAYAARLFDRLFTADVARSAAKEDLWSGVQGGEGSGSGRAPPTPLERGVLVPAAQADADAAAVESLRTNRDAATLNRPDRAHSSTPSVPYSTSTRSVSARSVGTDCEARTRS